jgi:2-phospho-L-lactate guanylyltransferase
VRFKAILPVKAIDRGKTRLGGVLDDDARAALCRRFLGHVLDVACAFPGPADTIVVSADRRVLDAAEARGAHALGEAEDDDLNSALRRATRFATSLGADAVLVLPVDLPLVTAEDLLALATAGAPVVIAPDRRGTGTNALWLAPPGAIPFHFGEDSFTAHLAAARAAGLEAAIVHRPNLVLDVDTPDDYRAWRTGHIAQPAAPPHVAAPTPDEPEPVEIIPNIPFRRSSRASL